MALFQKKTPGCLARHGDTTSGVFAHGPTGQGCCCVCAVFSGVCVMCCFDKSVDNFDMTFSGITACPGHAMTHTTQRVSGSCGGRFQFSGGGIDGPEAFEWFVNQNVAVPDYRAQVFYYENFLGDTFFWGLTEPWPSGPDADCTQNFTQTNRFTSSATCGNAYTPFGSGPAAGHQAGYGGSVSMVAVLPP